MFYVGLNGFGLVGFGVGGVGDVSVVGVLANYVIDVTEIADIVRKFKF